MRVTADTNIVISGFFWKGNPRKILDAARDRIIDLYATEELLTELYDVLSRERFHRYLLAAGTSPTELVEGYGALATVVEQAQIESVVLRDPDDDAVLACAAASQSDAIVSGDDDLLSLGQYKEIVILSATDLLAKLNL